MSKPAYETASFDGGESIISVSHSRSGYPYKYSVQCCGEKWDTLDCTGMDMTRQEAQWLVNRLTKLLEADDE